VPLGLVSHACRSGSATGNVLFLGLGSLPAPTVGLRHAVPTFELQTHFARWYVLEEGERRHAGATTGVERLVGNRTRRYRLLRNGGLVVTLERGLRVLVTPMAPRDDREAWCIRGADGLYVRCNCSGVKQVVDARDRLVRLNAPDEPSGESGSALPRLADGGPSLAFTDAP
jgi:hypothetical protein